VRETTTSALYTIALKIANGQFTTHGKSVSPPTISQCKQLLDCDTCNEKTDILEIDWFQSVQKLCNTVNPRKKSLEAEAMLLLWAAKCTDTNARARVVYTVMTSLRLDH
jgi:hypothetical protein